jgi:hypothetical protein
MADSRLPSPQAPRSGPPLENKSNRSAGFLLPLWLSTYSLKLPIPQGPGEAARIFPVSRPVFDKRARFFAIQGSKQK